MSGSTASARNKHSKGNLKHNNNKNKNNDEPIDITKDEFERIREALGKEEFRKLFFEYVDEIQDPANRKIYEDEITQLEKERGVEVTFIHPQPGFVVKTSIDGEQKCFINIAGSPEIARPESKLDINPDTGDRGLSWSIPMAQTASRDDCDAKNQQCKVFDVVFHPDALHLGQKNSQFRKCLIDTALDAVEREYEVNLDRTNLKYPKLDYKGIARPTVIRKLSKNPTDEELEPHPLEHSFPTKPTAGEGEPKVLPMKVQKEQPKAPKFTEPKYSIKYSHDVDLSEYTNELDAKLQVTKPRALVVEIELPLLRSTAECELDVTSKSIYLLSERAGAKYRLKLDLPYTVDDKSGRARFDTDKRRLNIHLPVIRSNEPNLRLLSREDSGVELHSNSESPVEEEEDGEDEIEAEEEEEEVKTKVKPTSNPPSFLKSSLHYQLPGKFDCNLLDNCMAFTLHVANVQPDSIEYVQEKRSLHLQFASMGNGYYPTHYAFYVALPAKESQLIIENVEAEAWDNNVILKLDLNKSSESIESYLAGLDDQDLQDYAIHGQFKALKEAPVQEDKPGDIQFKRNDQEPSLEITVSGLNAVEQQEREEGEIEEAEEQQHKKSASKKQRGKRNKKERSLSESACVSLPTSVDSQPMATLKLPQRKQRSFSECHEQQHHHHRGILKRFSRYDGNDSCSSIDDCSSSYPCSVEASRSFGGIPEEDSSLSESCKKTVRFNDHIMKQVFRLDSSILGQRKKNQKRRDCKLRAQQRRLSEGDSADYEESTANKTQYCKYNKKHHHHHDSGLDLTRHNKKRELAEEADNKNSLMFEMDDDDDDEDEDLI
ncbi:uncharacterized protein Dwil_GK27737 [Drosophila willistoni]|uniref:Protein kintoun n=1 Tax=Drosophila willistoni TaxID=7260 RepID=KTU_DROWI|nr:protein kintoun [Drosophila willistoni]P0CU29.1 RecName: Full=Protein kintoun; AltName: Full=Dynein assembly factor 2, axonemal homolog; AltName: Full=PP1-interacting protein 20 [Drosophila willistoni]KRF97886.1 uncharacterized protein Dwil_GK27737 [Drosophila willistoni]